jgi:hypothetical protein
MGTDTVSIVVICKYLHSYLHTVSRASIHVSTPLSAIVGCYVLAPINSGLGVIVVGREVTGGVPGSVAWRAESYIKTNIVNPSLPSRVIFGPFPVVRDELHIAMLRN